MTRLYNAAALVFLIVLGAFVAISVAAIIFFSVAWLLTEGTTP